MKTAHIEATTDRLINDKSADLLRATEKARRFLKCTVITDLESLDAIADDWRRIAGDEGTPFHTFGWNRAWYRHIAEKDNSIRTAVFVFLNGERIVGVLPCYRLGRALRLAGDDECDFQDILAEDESLIPGMLAHVFKYLKDEGCDLHFGRLASNGKLLSPLGMTAQRLGHPQFSRRHDVCSRFNAGRGAAEFLAKQKSKVRKQVNAALQQIEQQAPNYECRFYEGSKVNPTLVNKLAGLHIRNQNRRQGKSIFEGPAFRNFIAEVALRSDAGLRVATLETEQGELIAFDLGFHRGNYFSLYLGSSEERYSPSSPEIVLLYLQIEEWTTGGMEVYDFLCGNESYQYDYAGEAYQTVCQRVFRKSLAGRFRAHFAKA